MIRQIAHIILFFFLFTSSNYSQWIEQNSGVQEGLYSVRFTDNLNGWIVGGNGTVLNTSNAGIDWALVDVNETNHFNSIFFVNSLVGWIVGNNGTILKTTNSGINWFQQNSGVVFPLWDVFFVDENNGWIGTLTATAEVLKTTDSGETWVSIPTGIENTLTIFFTSEFNGWAGGWGGDLAKTSDGGLTWSIQFSGTNVSRTKIFFTNDQIGWTVGGGGKITKTSDGGESWLLLPFNSFEYLTSVHFINENVGWIVASDVDYTKIYKSNDGGYNWFEEFRRFDGTLSDISFSDPVNGWAVGGSGFIVKYDTTKFLQILSPNGGERLNASTGTTIQWISNNVNYINLFYSTNNGQNWLTIENKILNDEVYYWNPIPNTPSNNCLIKIVDVEDNSIYDVSDSTFSIIYEQYINLIFPNGGEKIHKNNRLHIEWESQQIDSVNIYLSLDNRSSWSNIVLDYSNPYPNWSYVWLVPDTTADSCFIKIESSVNDSIFDISSQSFRIVPMFSYFPLNVGNKWFFSQGLDGVIKLKLEIEKDTVLSDDYHYSKLNLSYVSNDSIYYTSYLRKEKDKIIAYPDRLILDYNMHYSDIVFPFIDYPFTATLRHVGWQNVFGRTLSTLRFDFNVYESYSYTDSIGFNTLYANDWNNSFDEYLLGCIIDGVVYGDTILVGVESNNKLPTAFYLSQNYPNPFNPVTKIKYHITELSFVRLKVYDVLGNEIATLVNEENPVGNYEVEFNGTGLPSGIYFYQLRVYPAGSGAGNLIETKKMVLLK